MLCLYDIVSSHLSYSSSRHSEHHSMSGFDLWATAGGGIILTRSFSFVLLQIVVDDVLAVGQNLFAQSLQYISGSRLYLRKSSNVILRNKRFLHFSWRVAEEGQRQF